MGIQVFLLYAALDYCRYMTIGTQYGTESPMDTKHNESKPDSEQDGH